MKTFLFVWNPKNWDWEKLSDQIKEIESRGRSAESWTVQSHKKIKPGDRVFLVRVGLDPKGIMASGYVVSDSYFDKHWNGSDKLTPHVWIEFDAILDPEQKTLLSLETLNLAFPRKDKWTPRSSGVEIDQAVVGNLESAWFDVLATNEMFDVNTISKTDEPDYFKDGSPRQTIVTRYERNPHARQKCIGHYGYSCVVCGFNFESTFGELGRDFIHVHHLEQVASIGEEHDIDPLKDLRPVCPNCHAMIHKRKEPYSIEEIKEILEKNLCPGER